MIRKSFRILVILLLTSACVETVIVGSVATGTLIVRKKSLSATKDDIVIEAKIDKELISHDLKKPGNMIQLMVNEGRVMLIGVVQNVDKPKFATELAFKVAGVKEVIDETTIDEKGFKPRNISKALRDTMITTSINTQLLFNRKVASSNYAVTTVNRVVYLLGIASNDTEARKVMSVAARTSGVLKVVNHVILASDERRKDE